MGSYLLHKNPHNLISHFVLLCCQYFSPLVLSKRASHINHSFLLACGHFHWPWYWTSILCWLEGIVGHIETIDSTLSTGKSEGPYTCNVYQNRPLVACKGIRQCLCQEKTKFLRLKLLWCIRVLVSWREEHSNFY